MITYKIHILELSRRQQAIARQEDYPFGGKDLACTLRSSLFASPSQPIWMTKLRLQFKAFRDILTRWPRMRREPITQPKNSPMSLLLVASQLLRTRSLAELTGRYCLSRPCVVVLD